MRRSLPQRYSSRHSSVWLGLGLVLTVFCGQAQSPAEVADATAADKPAPGHHHISIDRAGSVMNHNDTTLPRDCDSLGSDLELTVYAGREFAAGVHGRTYGYSEHDYQADPCSRITVTLINNDAIRHQWMIHGLPRYLYPGGMFHLEAAGGQTRTGTFIVPSDDRTYLVHCDMPQHMEKGMKAQLVVGRGSGDLWSIPSVSDDLRRDTYLPDKSLHLSIMSMFIGLFVTALLLFRRRFF